MSLVVEVDGVALPDGALTIRGAPNSGLPGGVQGLPLAAWYGEALTGGYVIDDPEGDYDFTGLHTIVAYETASSRPFITGGWITGRRISRGIYKDGPGRVHDVDFIDINWNFALMVFRASSAKRPAETDLARAAFIQASAPMAFTPSFDNGRFNVTDNPVSFDDSDLVTKYPIEAFNEFAGIAGKNFYNYWDNAAEQISIHYDLVGVGPSATIAISNDMADSDSTTFYPFLDAELDKGPAYKVTGMLLGYRGAYAYGINQDTINDLSPSLFSPEEFQRDEVYTTDRIGRAATANAQIVSMLEDRAEDTDTIKVSIRVPAAQVNDAYPGEIMDVKFTHLPGYETVQQLPIIRRNVVPTDGRVDMYDIHFELSGQGLPSGPGGGDPGEFPHQPAECNPSIVQTKVFSDALGGSGSGTPDTPFTDGNVLVVAIYERGDDTLVAPNGGYTQIETQQFDNRSGTAGTNQAVAMWYKEVNGDTDVSWTAEPSHPLRIAVTEITGTGVVPTDSAVFSDDTHRTPPTVFTMPFGSLTVTAGGIIVGAGIVGTGPVDSSTCTMQDGAVKLFHEGWGSSGGPSKVLAYKTIDADGTYEMEAEWVANAWGQGVISAFFECGAESSLCPDAGVWVRDKFIAEGDGTTTVFNVGCPYADGSMNVRVDGLPILVGLTESDPEAGEFTLDFAPLAAEGDAPAEQIYVSYQGR